ncbi:MAG TPA: TetR/AcrR family transcriptional regulator [Candidatus Paceibacterota bacterium]|nr:TetR/AcrR family transcriptional regulator [Candidatus Paceibacterota bacterium]
MSNDNQGEKPLNRRQYSKIRTREGVIAAGRALFMEGGYAKATIRDIAKRIPRGADKPRGMSTGAVFANFGSKAELLLTVVEEDLEFHKELLERTASEEGTVLELVAKICTSDFVFFKDRLYLMEALATIETLVEPEKEDPLATARWACLLTERRRERIRFLIWEQLDAVGCGNAPFNQALPFIVGAHLERCRQATFEGVQVDRYRKYLQRHFFYLLPPNILSLAA